MIIYLITNLVNGKVYVGQTNRTLRTRWYNHKYDAIQRNEDFPICRAIRKYGPENFTIVELATCETREWSDYFERVWILLYDSRNDKVGYNIREGGNSSAMPASTKEALRASRLGKTHSEETKKLIGEASKRAWLDGRLHGRPHTPEALEKMRIVSTGKSSAQWIDKLNDVLLVSLYNHHVPITKMAEYFGVNPKTIHKHMKRTGLPIRKMEHKYIDEDLLEKLCGQGCSIIEMSKQLGCTFVTTQKRMKALGLTRKEAA